MHNAEKTKIKDAILLGVYEENRGLARRHLKADRSDQKSDDKTISRGLPVLPALLFVAIFGLFHFFSTPTSHRPEEPVAVSKVAPAVPGEEMASTTPPSGVASTVTPLESDSTISPLQVASILPPVKIDSTLSPPEVTTTLIPAESGSTISAAEVASTIPPLAIVPEQVADNYIVLSSLSISDSAFRPVVPFSVERMLNYNFLFNSEQVRLSSVFGLDVQTIVIDPGHGGKDPGAIGSQGSKEKEIVMDIGLRLRDELMQSGQYRVLLTRETDTFISLADRVKYSNAEKADLFISLHINALPQKQSNVTETFYFGPPSEIYTLRLAEQENRGSQILSGDFRNMIKKIGDVLKEQESATLATTIQDSLFSNLAKYDRDIVDNGTKIAPFVVLLGVDAPSVLVEISCISQKEEEAKLNETAYRERIISSLKAGITGYLSNRHTQVVRGDDNGKKSGKSNNS